MADVTITKSGRFDSFGNALQVGTTYTLADDFASSLVSSGFGNYANGSSGPRANTPFLQTPITDAVRNLGAFSDFGGVAVQFGDSLTANGYIDSTQSTTCQNWLQHASAKAGGVIRRFINAGVSGQNTEQILARVAGVLSANNPDLVVFGPNSVNDLAQVFTSARSIVALRAAFDLARTWPSVRAMCVTTVHPTNTQNLAGVGGDGGRAWYRDVNAFVEAYARTYDIPLLPAYQVFTNADGSAIRSGYSVAAGDGVHWSYQGAFEFGAAITPTISKLSSRVWESLSSANDARNMLGPWATALQGSNASGANGVSSGTGATITSAPNGMFARRFTGDSTATGTVTSIASPVGLPGQSAQMVCTLGADAGAIGIGFGHEVSSRNRFDNARASSQAYTYGERIAINARYCAQVFTPGTSAAAGAAATAAVDALNAAPLGGYVQDGTVVWQVTYRPQITDRITLIADVSLDTLTSGSGDLEIWCTAFDSAANNYTTYINYCGATTQSPWPTRVDSKRRLLINEFSLGGQGSTLVDVRTMAVYALFRGANGAQGTIQLHRVAAILQ